MPEFDEQQQGTPVVRSMASVTMQINFSEMAENWSIEGSNAQQAGPHPIRILISNENSVSCHFLSLEETETLIAKLTETLRVARTGLVVTSELPPPSQNGKR
jgi:hypothetical protein